MAPDPAATRGTCPGWPLPHRRPTRAPPPHLRPHLRHVWPDSNSLTAAPCTAFPAPSAGWRALPRPSPGRTGCNCAVRPARRAARAARLSASARRAFPHRCRRCRAHPTRPAARAGPAARRGCTGKAAAFPPASHHGDSAQPRRPQMPPRPKRRRPIMTAPAYPRCASAPPRHRPASGCRPWHPARGAAKHVVMARLTLASARPGRLERRGAFRRLAVAAGTMMGVYAWRLLSRYRLRTADIAHTIANAMIVVAILCANKGHTSQPKFLPSR